MVTKYKSHYKCLWCGWEFSSIWGKSESSKDAFGSKHRPVLSVVTCPNCGNNLKPEKDAIRTEEL